MAEGPRLDPQLALDEHEAGLRCFPLPPSPYNVLLTVTYSDVHADVLSRAIQHLHFLVVGQR